MTIQEAIRSGKRFKRKECSFLHKCGSNCLITFTRQEVLADDWEIEQPESQKVTITLTLNEFEYIYRNAFQNQNECSFFDSLKKSLGFK